MESVTTDPETLNECKSSGTVVPGILYLAIWGLNAVLLDRVWIASVSTSSLPVKFSHHHYHYSTWRPCKKSS